MGGSAMMSGYGAFLYRGLREGLSSEPIAVVQTDGVGDTNVSAGDINGDDPGDVIVGTPWYENGERQEGAVRLYLGSADGLGPNPVWGTEGDEEHANLGEAVVSAGDVDVDDLGDLLVAVREGGLGGAYTFRLFLGSAARLWITDEDEARLNLCGGNAVRVRLGPVDGSGSLALYAAVWEERDGAIALLGDQTVARLDGRTPEGSPGRRLGRLLLYDTNPGPSSRLSPRRAPAVVAVGTLGGYLRLEGPERTTHVDQQGVFVGYRPGPPPGEEGIGLAPLPSYAYLAVEEAGAFVRVDVQSLDGERTCGEVVSPRYGVISDTDPSCRCRRARVTLSGCQGGL